MGQHSLPVAVTVIVSGGQHRVVTVVAEQVELRVKVRATRVEDVLAIDVCTRAKLLVQARETALAVAEAVFAVLRRASQGLSAIEEHKWHRRRRRRRARRR